MPKSSIRTTTVKEKAKNVHCRLRDKVGSVLVLSVFALISGCADRGVVDAASGEIKYESPDRKVSDYSRVRCDGDIWKSQNDGTNANALYWLRLISCARTFTPMQARVQSYGYDNTMWDGVFKRAILLSKLDLNSQERRSALEQLKNLQTTYPESVYSLIQMWRSEQLLQLSLQDEKARAQRQKEGAESLIADLQLQIGEIKHQLYETTRKLQNLTDIERQLSSRKMAQGESSPSADAEFPINANPSTPESEPHQAAPTDKPVSEVSREQPAVATEHEKPAVAEPVPGSESKTEKSAPPASVQPEQEKPAPTAQKP